MLDSVLKKLVQFGEVMEVNKTSKNYYKKIQEILDKKAQACNEAKVRKQLQKECKLP